MDVRLSSKIVLWYNYEFIMELGKVLEGILCSHKVKYWCE